LQNVHRGPRLTGKRVGEARLQLLEQGFVVVATPWYFDDALFVRWKRRRTVLPFHCKRWWKYPELARYACWLEQLLRDALPEEEVSLAELEYRHEPAGSVDLQVDGLHIDGSYIRSVCTLHGPTTLYRDGDADLPVSQRHTLLMTAVDRTRALRIPATLHRRPGAGAERAVIVCSFEPHWDGPYLENLYRRAAQTCGRR